MDRSPAKEVDPKTRIVVTGMGTVNPLGIGVEESWKNLIAGKSGIVENRFDKYPQIKASVAGKVQGFAPMDRLKGILKPSTIKNRLHESAQFSVYSSYEALSQAGLLTPDRGEDSWNGKLKVNPEIVNPTEVGVIIGTGVGGSGEIAIKAQAALDAGDLASAFDILQLLPERISSTVSMAFGIEGRALSPSAACATGNVAIDIAVSYIRSGKAKVMVAGSTESSNIPYAIEGFDVLGALDAEPDPKKTPRPFDKSAGGFVFGNGAGVIVLERLDVARARNAHIIAELTGTADFSDAKHDTAPSGKGAELALREIVKETRERGHNGPVYGNAHGTGTPTGDPIEAGVITKIVKDQNVKLAGLSSTKSATGHLLGGAAGVEAIFSLKALETQTMPPTLHVENPIEEAQELNLVPNEAQAAEFDTVVSNAFGFGGLNAVVAFSKYK
jgi:3-oxoacyl-[acyl-carrier-protein] synthase II